MRPVVLPDEFQVVHLRRGGRHGAVDVEGFDQVCVRAPGRMPSTTLRVDHRLEDRHAVGHLPAEDLHHALEGRHFQCPLVRLPSGVLAKPVPSPHVRDPLKIVRTFRPGLLCRAIHAQPDVAEPDGRLTVRRRRPVRVVGHDLVVPVGRTMNVSSALTPVIDGFQAKAMSSLTRVSFPGVATASRPW